MKHNHFFLLPLLASLALLGIFTSCETTKGASSSDEQGVYFKNPQTEEKLLIEEWKYMGFGQPFPQWVIAALENQPEKIKSLEPELTDTDVVIMQATGYNLDQADNGLKEQKKPAGYKLYDSFWVKINNIEKMYISVAVYYK